MPDGDRIQKLPRKYAKLYRQVCEGNFSSYELAHVAAPPLIADVKEYGELIEKELEDAAKLPFGM